MGSAAVEIRAGKGGRGLVATAIKHDEATKETNAANTTKRAITALHMWSATLQVAVQCKYHICKPNVTTYKNARGGHWPTNPPKENGMWHSTKVPVTLRLA